MKRKVFIIALVSFTLIFLTACGNTRYVELPDGWENNEMSSLIPKPYGESIEITWSLDWTFNFVTYGNTEDDYFNYKEDCEDSGFTEVYINFGHTYRAGNEDGYVVYVYFNENDKTIQYAIENHTNL